jgi:hypothetical protein
MVEGKTTGIFHGAACNISCQNEFHFQQHIYGKKHKKRDVMLDVDQPLNDGAFCSPLLVGNERFNLERYLRIPGNNRHP